MNEENKKENCIKESILLRNEGSRDLRYNLSIEHDGIVYTESDYLHTMALDNEIFDLRLKLLERLVKKVAYQMPIPNDADLFVFHTISHKKNQ